MRTLMLILVMLLMLTVSTGIAAQHSKIHGFNKGTYVSEVILGMSGPYDMKIVKSYDRLYTKHPKMITERTYGVIIYTKVDRIIVFRFNYDGYLISGATYPRM